MNGKDDRHETLASNSQTADTSNASLDDYFSLEMAITCKLGARPFANLGFVASNNEILQATQSQLFFSVSALYRYQIFGVRSLVAYSFDLIKIALAILRLRFQICTNTIHDY